MTTVAWLQQPRQHGQPAEMGRRPMQVSKPMLLHFNKCYDHTLLSVTHIIKLSLAHVAPLAGAPSGNDQCMMFVAGRWGAAVASGGPFPALPDHPAAILASASAVPAAPADADEASLGSCPGRLCCSFITGCAYHRYSNVMLTHEAHLLFVHAVRSFCSTNAIVKSNNALNDGVHLCTQAH